MPPLKKVRRQQKRIVVPNVSQRPGGTNPSTTPSRRLNPLPPQYNFTPAAEDPLNQSPQSQVPVFVQYSTTAPHIGNYPPPQRLFQTGMPQQREEVASPSSHEVQNNPLPQSTPRQDNVPSPLQNSQAQSHPSSSQGNNFEEPAPVPALEEEMLQALNALLLVPNRDRFTTVLSPTLSPNSTWYVHNKLLTFVFVSVLESVFELFELF